MSTPLTFTAKLKTNTKSFLIITAQTNKPKFTSRVACLNKINRTNQTKNLEDLLF